MSLDLRLDGEVIASIDEQVTAVRLMTARGETAATGLSMSEGVIDIIVDRVAPAGPRRLDQEEAAVLEDIRNRAKEGDIVGFARDFQVHPAGMRQDQGVHTETLAGSTEERDERIGAARETRRGGGIMTRDLAEGLAPDDVETRTRRLEAFAEHGDANRAVEENMPGGEVGDLGTAADSLSSPDSPAVATDDRSGIGAGEGSGDNLLSGPGGSSPETSDQGPTSSDTGVNDAGQTADSGGSEPTPTTGMRPPGGDPVGDPNVRTGTDADVETENTGAEDPRAGAGINLNLPTAPVTKATRTTKKAGS